MIDVALVSIAFPPKNDPEALQTARYFKYLVRTRDVRVDVVTSRSPTLWMPIDPSLAPYADGARQTVEVPIFEPRLASVAIAKLAPSLAMMPDLRRSFVAGWRRARRELRARPDVVYSRSMPLSSALMGERLSRSLRAPWVMHLSDPWADSPILRFRGIAAHYNRRAEARCFARAAAVTVASQRMVETITSRFPPMEGRVVWMPNVFDPDDVQSTPSPKRPPLRLVYTGSLGTARPIGPVIAALDEATRREPGARDAIRLVIAGPRDSATDRLLRDAMSRLPIEVLGQLSFAEARAMQRGADVLLAIDSPLASAQSVFLPSKLLDYSAARRWILAVTPRRSATEQYLGDGTRGTCFEHADVAGLASWLGRAALALARGSSEIPALAPPPDETYSAAHNAARLADVLRRARELR